MNVVLASRYDAVARRFVHERGAKRFALVSPRDLSIPGWLLVPDRVHDSVAVVEGQRIPASEIEGVFVRLPGVDVGELPHVAASDRAFVAAEMHAFLFAFLSALQCPVLNRPTASCLAGPALRPLQWLARAAALGIPVPPRRDLAAAVLPSGGLRTNLVCVTVLGETTLGPGAVVLHDWARALAAQARTPLLRVWFDPSIRQGELVSVDLWPDLDDQAVANAIANELLGRSTC